MALHHELTDSQLRWFGASLAAMLAIFAALAQWRWDLPLLAGLLGGASVVLLGVYYAAPATRRPIYRAVQRITYPIQVVATTLLLAVLYYAVVTPIGVVLRLRGYDPLDRQPRGSGTESTSYWRKRPPPPPAERYFKTF